MSTNTALDQIKARVEGHSATPWEIRADHGEQPGIWHDSEAVFPIGQCADCGVEAAYAPADAELIAAAPKLLAALEAVEALHRPDADTGKCEECTYAQYSRFSVRYPCPTIKAIEEALR